MLGEQRLWGWTLLLGGVLLAFSCGGRTRSDAESHRDAGDSSAVRETERDTEREAGASDGMRSCVAEGCEGVPCQVRSECPEGSSHYQDCLPESCGGQPVCRYMPVTAGAPSQRLVCSCGGQLEIVGDGIGGPPVVYAYAFSTYLQNLCNCYEGASEDVTCERSVCLGGRCDSGLVEAPKMTSMIVGSDLPWPDGTRLLVFDAADGSFLLGNGSLQGGKIELDLGDIFAGPRLLIDENGDGACNVGEPVLRYYKEFVPTEGMIRYVPIGNELIACESRLESSD